MVNDSLILTVRPVHEPDNIIGGANLPLSRASLSSFNFVMNEKNALPSLGLDAQSVWIGHLSNDDLIVEAIVCPSLIRDEATGDTRKLLQLCNKQSQPTASRGISKLVRLDQEGGIVSVRAAVTLALE